MRKGRVASTSLPTSAVPKSSVPKSSVSDPCCKNNCCKNGCRSTPPTLVRLFVQPIERPSQADISREVARRFQEWHAGPPNLISSVESHQPHPLIAGDSDSTMRECNKRIEAKSTKLCASDNRGKGRRQKAEGRIGEAEHARPSLWFFSSILPSAFCPLPFLHAGQGWRRTSAVWPRLPPTTLKRSRSWLV